MIRTGFSPDVVDRMGNRIRVMLLNRRRRDNPLDDFSCSKPKWYEYKCSQWRMENKYYRHNYTRDIGKLIARSKGRVLTVSSLWKDTGLEEAPRSRACGILSSARFSPADSRRNFDCPEDILL